MDCTDAEVKNLKDENKKLREQVAALKKDKELLDWIDKDVEKRTELLANKMKQIDSREVRSGLRILCRLEESTEKENLAKELDEAEAKFGGSGVNYTSEETADNMREEFEAWCRSQPHPNFSLMPWPEGPKREDGLYDGPVVKNGEYYAAQTQSAWRGWQAAWEFLGESP